MDTHYDIVRVEKVGSTQDNAAAAFAESGNPILVIARRQLQGRGRQGRGWIEPTHGVYTSLALRPGWDPEFFPLLPLCVGVAVREAIGEHADSDVALKWPNDLLIDRRKVGGILVEASDGVVTAGCGVNLAWRDAPDFATALFGHDPGPDVATSIARSWADRFSAIVDAGPGAWPEAEYRAACVTLGSRVAWNDQAGTAVDLTDYGALVVETSEGVVIVNSGDVHLQGHG